MKRKQTYEEKLASMTDREFAKEWEKVMKAINPSRNVAKESNTSSNTR